MLSHSASAPELTRCTAQSITPRFLKSSETSSKLNLVGCGAINKNPPAINGWVLTSKLVSLFAEYRNEHKCRRIGKIWRRPFFWRRLCNFFRFLSSTEILGVLAINRADAAAGQ